MWLPGAVTLLLLSAGGNAQSEPSGQSENQSDPFSSTSVVDPQTYQLNQTVYFLAFEPGSAQSGNASGGTIDGGDASGGAADGSDASGGTADGSNVTAYCYRVILGSRIDRVAVSSDTSSAGESNPYGGGESNPDGGGDGSLSSNGPELTDEMCQSLDYSQAEVISYGTFSCVNNQRSQSFRNGTRCSTPRIAFVQVRERPDLANIFSKASALRAAGGE